MAKQKYYVVRRGKTPGIYLNWPDCQKQVDGFPGALFKSFGTIEEAAAWLSGEKTSSGRQTEHKPEKKKKMNPAGNAVSGTGKTTEMPSDTPQKLITVEADGREYAEDPRKKENYAFVDGSYNSSAGVYGYGGFLMACGQRVVLQGNGNDPEMASMHNVAGEILGSMAAVTKACEMGLPTLTIYYDYLGIEKWALGDWKRNKQGTMGYYRFMQDMQKKIRIRFVKVKGHSGVEGNEEADRLAKQAAGILPGYCGKASEKEGY